MLKNQVCFMGCFFFFFSLPFAVLVIEHKDGNIDSALKKNRMTADYFYSESTLNLKI